MPEKRMLVECRDCHRWVEGTRRMRYCLGCRKLRQATRVKGWRTKQRAEKIVKAKATPIWLHCEASCPYYATCKIEVFKGSVLPCLPLIGPIEDRRAETKPSAIHSNFRMAG